MNNKLIFYSNIEILLKDMQFFNPNIDQTELEKDNEMPFRFNLNPNCNYWFLNLRDHKIQHKYNKLLTKIKRDNMSISTIYIYSKKIDKIGDKLFEHFIMRNKTNIQF